MLSTTLEKLSEDLKSKTECDQVFLTNYKLHNNLGFPLSYVQFAKTLGWGRLCGLFLVYVPLKTYPDSWGLRSRYIRGLMDEFYQFVETDAKYEFLLEPDGSFELVKNAIPFAMSENGEYLIWDIMNPDERGEFPIYMLAARMGGVNFAGRDLIHFINMCIDDEKVKIAMGSGYNKLPLTFEPIKIHHY